MCVVWTIHFLFTPTIKSRTVALAATLAGTTATGLYHRYLIVHVLGEIAAVETLLLLNTRTQRIVSWPLPSVHLPPWFC